MGIPGSGIFHVALAARIRRSWCWISSCSFGTLASFARLPIKEVVMSSRVKSGDMLTVSTGVGEVGNGGVIVICDDSVVRNRSLEREIHPPMT